MIINFNDLVNKTIELEERINKINKSIINNENNNYFSLFNNNNIYKSIITQKTISLAKFNNSKQQMFYQVCLNFSISSKQKIEFYLIANNNRIGHVLTHFEVGNNSVNLSGIYQDVTSENIEIKILVNPKEDKLVILNSSNLTVWGNRTVSQDNEFNAIETEDEYILTFQSNNKLYFKNFKKENIDLQNDIEFNYLLPAISHSICYSENDKKTYLFRVDNFNNLFLSNFGEFNEIFIANNVTNCSLISYNDSLIFSFIKNKKCYVGEIKNDTIVSCNSIKQISGEHKKCYLYFNNYNGKIYFILTKKDGANYLFENISKNFSSGENLKASIGLNISTYEVEEWSFHFITK